MDTKSARHLISAALTILLLAGCGGASRQPTAGPTQPPPPAPTEPTPIGMANPASVYCEEQGGTLDIREESGGSVGYCIFPDGSECEEWSFFRGECAPGSAEKELRPPSQEVCDGLATALQQALGVDATTEEAPFVDQLTGEAGTGCLITVTGSGHDFENLAVVTDATLGMLQAQGWEEDTQYAGGGPGGMMAGYRKDNAMCLVLLSAVPVDSELCPPDEPIAVCWEKLTPEQKLFTVTMNCVE